MRVFLFTLGVAAMLAADPADAQPKAPYDQFVKVEGKDEKGKAFTLENVPAYRPNTPAPIWRVPIVAVGPTGTGYTSVAVTDKDGKKYGIEKVTRGTGYYQLWIAPEPKF